MPDQYRVYIEIKTRDGAPLSRDYLGTASTVFQAVTLARYIKRNLRALIHMAEAQEEEGE